MESARIMPNLPGQSQTPLSWGRLALRVRGQGACWRELVLVGSAPVTSLLHPGNCGGQQRMGVWKGSSLSNPHPLVRFLDVASRGQQKELAQNQGHYNRPSLFLCCDCTQVTWSDTTCSCSLAHHQCSDAVRHILLFPGKRSTLHAAVQLQQVFFLSLA